MAAKTSNTTMTDAVNALAHKVIWDAPTALSGT